MIQVKITMDELENLSACMSGVNDFLEEFGGEYVSDWSKEDQIALLTNKRMGRWLEWATVEGIIPGFRIENAEIEGKGIGEVTLYSGRIAESSFRDTFISDLWLSKVDLRGTTFEDCTIKRLTLINCDLVDVSFVACSIEMVVVECGKGFPHFFNSEIDLRVEPQFWLAKNERLALEKRIVGCEGILEIANPDTPLGGIRSMERYILKPDGLAVKVNYAHTRRVNHD